MKFIKPLFKQYWGVFLYLIISVFAILPFFSEGFFNIHDNTQVERVYQMSRALADGMFPVRWVPDLGYGYGYAIFNFYSVLPYYIGGALVNLGLGVLLSTKILFASSIIFSGVSMYILVKKFYGEIPAIVSSVIYLYFPYHAVNAYVRGDLAELFAYVFLPLVFYSLFSLHISQGTAGIRKYIAIASVSIAAVVISHNLSAFMMFIFAFLFILTSIVISEKRKLLFIHYSIVMVLAFLLSAFYSLPAIFEMGYSNVLSQVGGGSHWRDHFVCVGQLWNSQWGFGGSAPGCLDGVSFKLGKLNILLTIGALAAAFLFRKDLGKNRFVIIFSIFALILSVFLVLDVSSLIWSVPFMDFLQFPWRFINFVGVFAALVVGFFVWIISKKLGGKLGILIAISTISLTIFTNQQLFKPQIRIEEGDGFYTDRERINWTVSKISDEYLPEGFDKPESAGAVPEEKTEIVAGEGTIDNEISKTNYISSKITMENAGTVRINIAYFPAWSVYVDGEKTSYVIRNDGLYIALSKGERDVEVKFEETPIEKVANSLTLVGVILFIAVIINKRRSKIYG